MNFPSLVRFIVTTVPEQPATLASEFLCDNTKLGISGLGPWVAVTVAVPAFVAGYVATLALRGARPEQRAEILRAVATLTAALLLRGSHTCAEKSVSASTETSENNETKVGHPESRHLQSP